MGPKCYTVSPKYWTKRQTKVTGLCTTYYVGPIVLEVRLTMHVGSLKSRPARLPSPPASAALGRTWTSTRTSTRTRRTLTISTPSSTLGTSSPSQRLRARKTQRRAVCTAPGRPPRLNQPRVEQKHRSLVILKYLARVRTYEVAAKVRIGTLSSFLLWRKGVLFDAGKHTALASARFPTT